jgi:NTE family protein
MFNPLKYIWKRKVGLALGSGSVKGFAHIAVIEYLQSLGIPIHIIAGSSIGAIVGALYSVGALFSFREDVLRLTKRDFWSLFDPLFPRSGLMQGKRLHEFLQKYIPSDARIEDLPVSLAIMATDYQTGQSVCFRSGNVLEAVRASISIPGIFVPVRYHGTWLIDGGVANPLPVNVLRHMGAGMTIAVNLHPRIMGPAWHNPIKSRVRRPSMIVDSQDMEISANDEPLSEPAEAEKKIASGMPPYLAAVGDWLRIEHMRRVFVKEKKPNFPSIFETINQAIDIQEYINTMMMLKYNRPTVLIEPDSIGVGILDFTRIPEVIEEGRKASLRAHGALVRRVKRWAV